MNSYRLIFLLLWSCFGLSQNTLEATMDSIYKYRMFSINEKTNYNKSLKYAKKAIKLSEILNRDSTLLKSKSVLSSVYYNYNKFIFLKKETREVLDMAAQLKDSVSIARAYMLLGNVEDVEGDKGKAYLYYSNSSKLYRAVSQPQKEVIALYNMSSIQYEEKDYVGAEINAVKIIKFLETQPKTQKNIDFLRDTNNLLGAISSSLKQFNIALQYYEKALGYSSKLKNQASYLDSEINILLIYIDTKQYQKAINGYHRLLDRESLKSDDPVAYAYIVSNLAYAKSLNNDKDKAETTRLFKTAMRLSMQIDDLELLISTSCYYSEFLIDEEIKDSALYYNDFVFKKASKVSLPGYVLKALANKAEIQKDSSSYFLNQYIRITDSLLQKERQIRNKFIRIAYETEEVKQKNKQASKQNFGLVFVLLVLLPVLFLLYLLSKQRQKNRLLSLKRKQQKAAQEMNNLLLSQQDQINQVRSLEQNRISKEIHDGILGRLFGVRLSLDGLNLNNSEEMIQKRSDYINQLKYIEEDIRKVSHDLNTDFIPQTGYSELLKLLVDSQMAIHSVDFKIDIDDAIDWKLFDNRVKLHLYRILQETFQNIHKHAKASKVKIIFVLKKNQLLVEVSDNGKGFDILEKSKGIGLQNVEARVKEIKGQFNIETIKSKGTKIIIKVPISLNN